MLGEFFFQLGLSGFKFFFGNSPLIKYKHLTISHLFKNSLLNEIYRSGLELIASKWAHSLTELDLAWANVQEALDNALRAIAEKGSESLLKYVDSIQTHTHMHTILLHFDSYLLKTQLYFALLFKIVT